MKWNRLKILTKCFSKTKKLPDKQNVYTSICIYNISDTRKTLLTPNSTAVSGGFNTPGGRYLWTGFDMHTHMQLNKVTGHGEISMDIKLLLKNDDAFPVKAFVTR